MLSRLTRAALGALAVATSLAAQQRSETVPVTSNDPAVQPFVADVYGSNYPDDVTIVGFVARVDDFSFGSGTLVSTDSNGYEELTYENRGFTFYVNPQWAWGAWAVGLGTCVFTLEY